MNETRRHHPQFGAPGVWESVNGIRGKQFRCTAKVEVLDQYDRPGYPGGALQLGGGSESEYRAITRVQNDGIPAVNRGAYRRFGCWRAVAADRRNWYVESANRGARRCRPKLPGSVRAARSRSARGPSPVPPGGWTSSTARSKLRGGALREFRVRLDPNRRQDLRPRRGARQGRYPKARQEGVPTAPLRVWSHAAVAL